jgi:hypothetical protein
VASRVHGLLVHGLAYVVSIEQGSALFPDEPSRADGMRPRRPGGALPAAFRVELTGSGQGGRATDVRVTVIDAATGRRLGAVSVPFDWFRDIGYCGTVMAEIETGVWP